MKKSDFPFEAVYDKLARFMIDKGLPQEDMPAALFVAKIIDGEPEFDLGPPISSLMNSRSGKLVLNRLIGTIVTALPDDMCVVFLSEAYLRGIKIEDGQDYEQARAALPAMLKDDPESQEVMMINIFRRGENRTGSLPIGPNRTLTYAPLNKMAHTMGDLIPEESQTPKEKMQ